jgi:outer membrane protein assembly factor BamB
VKQQAILSAFVPVFAVSIVLTGRALSDEWPQWRGPARDGVWRETGVIQRFPSDTLQHVWSVPVGPGYSGPTVADGRVYVTDRVAEPEQLERVHCFDWKNGAKIWSFQYPCPYDGIGYKAGPRAGVTLDEGRAYALGAMGHLHCFDAGSGAVLWKRDLNRDYRIQDASSNEDRMPIWGIAGAPLIYKNLVILHVGGRDGACVVALDKKSGEDVWRALDDRAQYSAPVLINQGGRTVCVVWTGDSVAGLDPANGKVYWRVPFTPRNMPIGISTPVVEQDRLFVTSFYDGSLMLRLAQDQPSVEKLWQRAGRDERNTDALHSIISTPIMQGDYIYGVDSYGELRCLDAKTGERIWEDQTATPRERWSNIHFVQHGDNVWMFNERGELIIGRLSPKGFEEIDRAKLIAPTVEQLRRRDGVTWAHPAFAYRHVFARNDKELVCASLEAN